ncbi:1-phosphofructokinase family hexose kinase [Pseudolysinimonas yzui]|uniref:1-phosphofructokinase n=1 Tax=Pseudolysinimonas yzui TaxID=2708254 RepID=A0A8J3M3X2_9MICO|nr:PfkB family carbohydrate kinase [Pseudolysinimonas yzui]GHF24626.1 1-phosphofructokinase [Pseudolysinimonas yzui]
MSDVVIFAPSPVLEITVEEHQADGDVHVHAGGQGVWQARMLLSLGRDVVLCSALSGETGRVLAHLLQEEGIRVAGIRRVARGGVYVHDRRDGERKPIIESGGDALTRHEQDELYGLTLRTGLDAKLVILSGPHGEGIVPADFYRRLAADLRTGGVRVVVDLAGERLDAALAGRVTVAKVSDEELLADGRIAKKSNIDQIVAAMRALHDAGAEVVVVTRAEESAFLLQDGAIHEVVAPRMEVVDSAGAGDSFVGAFCSVLAVGGSVSDAVLLGAAAGAQNVTRHGLGTGEAATIERLRELVVLRPLPGGGAPEAPAPPAREISPDDLAHLVEEATHTGEATP